MLPDEFVPTKTAFGSIFLPVIGMSSGRLRLSAGMLYSTQWTHVPIGASGSSTIRAKDWVPAGGSFQASAGEMFLPMQEYLAGMDCPFENASLVSSRDMVASVEGVIGDSEIGDWEIDGGVDSEVPDGVEAGVQAAMLSSKQIKRIGRITNFLFSLRGIAG